MRGLHFKLDRLGTEQQVRRKQQDTEARADDGLERTAVRFDDPGVRFRRTPEGRGRNCLVLTCRRCIRQFRRLGHVRAVLEFDLERQPAVDGLDDDSAAIELQFVIVVQPRARNQRLAVELHTRIPSERLHERCTVEQVQQHDGAATRAGQAQRAVAAGADAQRQLVRADTPFALDVPNGQMIETQIASSQRTTIGSMSISGATRNSRRTSRKPGRLPTAT